MRRQDKDSHGAPPSTRSEAHMPRRAPTTVAALPLPGQCAARLMTFGTDLSAGGIANMGGDIDRNEKEEFTVCIKHSASQPSRAKTGEPEQPTDTGQSSRKGLARGSVSAKERLIAPDLARGFMLLVIALAHAPFWLSADEASLPGRPMGGSAMDETVNVISTLLVDSRGMPLFGILLGYGLTMMVNRQLSAGTSESESRRLLRRRALYLIVFGFVHTVFIGGIDILAEYGLYTLLIGWLLFRGEHVLRRAILLVSLFYLLLLPIIWISMAHMVDVPMSAMVNSGSSSYLETTIINLINFPFMIIGGLFMYPMILPILIGIWAARKGLFERSRKQLARMALAGMTIAVIGGLPLALLGTPLWNSSATIEGASAVLHMMTGIAGGIGYAALFGLIGPVVGRRGPIFGSMVALGKRSLTFYLFIELMLVIILSPVAFGCGQMLHVTGAALVAVLVWIMSLLLALGMEHKNMRGPADALLRKLTYRR